MGDQVDLARAAEPGGVGNAQVGQVLHGENVGTCRRCGGVGIEGHFGQQSEFLGISTQTGWRVGVDRCPGDLLGYSSLRGIDVAAVCWVRSQIRQLLEHLAVAVGIDSIACAVCIDGEGGGLLGDIGGHAQELFSHLGVDGRDFQGGHRSDQFGVGTQKLLRGQIGQVGDVNGDRRRNGAWGWVIDARCAGDGAQGVGVQVGVCTGVLVHKVGRSATAGDFDQHSTRIVSANIDGVGTSGVDRGVFTQQVACRVIGLGRQIVARNDGAKTSDT